MDCVDDNGEELLYSLGRLFGEAFSELEPPTYSKIIKISLNKDKSFNLIVMLNDILSASSIDSYKQRLKSSISSMANMIIDATNQEYLGNFSYDKKYAMNALEMIK